MFSRRSFLSLVAFIPGFFMGSPSVAPSERRSCEDDLLSFLSKKWLHSRKELQKNPIKETVLKVFYPGDGFFVLSDKGELFTPTVMNSAIYSTAPIYKVVVGDDDEFSAVRTFTFDLFDVGREMFIVSNHAYVFAREGEKRIGTLIA